MVTFASISKVPLLTETLLVLLVNVPDTYCTVPPLIVKVLSYLKVPPFALIVPPFVVTAPAALNVAATISTVPPLCVVVELALNVPV